MGRIVRLCSCSSLALLILTAFGMKLLSNPGKCCQDWGNKGATTRALKQGEYQSKKNIRQMPLARSDSNHQPPLDLYAKVICIIYNLI